MVSLGYTVRSFGGKLLIHLTVCMFPIMPNLNTLPNIHQIVLLSLIYYVCLYVFMYMNEYASVQVYGDKRLTLRDVHFVCVCVHMYACYTCM